MNENEIVENLIFLSKMNLISLINSQTALQLLMKKVNIDAQEIAEMKKIVSSNSKTINELSEFINSYESKFKYSKRFEYLYHKLINNRDSLSNEEKLELDKMLKDTSTNNP